MKLTKLHVKIALASVALTIFSFLLIKFLSVDFIEHDRYNTYLGQLNEIDATLNKNVFELRYGNLTHYDPIITGIEELKSLEKRLIKSPSFIDREGQRQLQQILKDYTSTQQKKEELIEQFKSKNAVLKNSLYYFPILATELAQQASTVDDELAIRLNDLLRDVLIYNLTASEELAPKITLQINELLNNQERYALTVKAADLELAIIHVNIILKNKPAVDKLLEDLVSLPTTQRGDELYRTYTLQYENALKAVGFYRVLLYVFSVILISSISSYIILKLRKASQIVSAAKEELQQALEATQEAEEKYRSIFENSTDGIFQTTIEGEYLSANPTLAYIYAYSSPAELIATVTNISTQLYVKPNRRAEFVAAMQKNDSISQFESQVYCKDGSIIWISENARTVKDSAGNLLYYEGTVEDITERKRVQATLQESEKRLRMQQTALMELAMCQPLYSGELKAALREITETAARTLSVARTSVWLYNSDKSALQCIDLYELLHSYHSSGTELQAIDYPAYFKALETYRAIAAHKAHTDSRTKEFSQFYLTPLGINSMLDVPIRLSGQRVGVLCLEHIGPARKWALEEENFASYLAYMTSLAMESCDRKRAQEALREEQEKVERLLLNILPQPIAERLKQETGSIADSFEEVTVLFADIVGFTQLSATISPTQLVELLNEIFSTFDQLAERHDLEKIKTIGDAYMVVGGLPMPRSDHAQAIAEMAMDMQQEVAKFSVKNGQPFNIRIGINTGPVVAGVIGLKKFIYDLWGDTVNTASRMESHGIAGAIQVTATTYELLQNQYKFEKRGLIEVKGKGEMEAFLLTGRKVRG
ncbi:PAS domain S-box protein [Microcoleus sp. FACHB-672]|nr:PAS domain S-box protein [Microcoleus sp. FACHB-672]